MKKNIGFVLALYPTPVVVAGAMNGENPTWTLAAHVGIIGHDRILISLASAHYINQFIKKNRKVSLNIVDEAILSKADFTGSHSGSTMDKSKVFEYELGESGTPIIRKGAVTMECSVADTYITPGFESFICSVDNTYVEENYLNETGKINYHAFKPVLFEFPTYEYLKTGDVIGKCLSFQKNPQKV